MTWLSASGLAALSACTGVIVSPDPEPSPMPGSPSGMPPAAPVMPPAQEPGSGPPRPAPPALPVRTAGLRRLAHTEYWNTLGALIEDPVALDRVRLELVRDEHPNGYDNQSSYLHVTPRHLEEYLEVALQLGPAMAAKTRRDHPCLEASAPDASCLEAAVDLMGRRAFRRPLEASERRVLLEGVRAAIEPRDGLSWLGSRLLFSPNFLYRVEPTVSTEPREPNGWELASRLSYLLWRSMPDEELMRVAATGALLEPEVFRAQVERMLATDAASRALVDFHAQWFELGALSTLGKDPELYPEWTPELRQEVVEEVQRFVVGAVTSNRSFMDELHMGRGSVGGRRVRALYGLPENETGELLLPPERAGILTLAGPLAALAHSDQTSPTFRGVFVRGRLLCAPPPPPPPLVANDLPPVGLAPTARERLAMHVSDPSCQVCHVLFDPIGLGLEQFDAIGKYRTTESGTTIDPSGDAIWSDLGDFRGGVDLGRGLAASQEAAKCTAQHWLQFAFGRPLEAEDEPAMSWIAHLLGEERSPFMDVVRATLGLPALSQVFN